MAALGPWIREQEMKGFDRFWRQEKLDRIRRFRSQHPHIADLVCFPARFLDPVSESLNSEEILFRILFCQLEQKPAIAAAKIDLKWCDSTENFRQIELIEV